MTKSLIRKALLSVFITYIIAYIFYLLWFVFFPPLGVLPNYRLTYILYQCFINIFNQFITLTALGLLLSYSLLYNSIDFQGEDPTIHFHKIVRPVLILVIVLAMFYTVLIIWVHPLQSKANQDILFKSQLAKNYLDQAINEFQKENYLKAMHYVEYSLKINTNYKKALQTESEIRKKIKALNIDLSKSQKNETEMNSKKIDEELEKEANEFLIIARKYYKKEDYFTAYYNAKRAFELDPQRKDADELSINAMNHISDNLYSFSDNQEQKKFKAKTEAYNALFSKDISDYIKAYYIFKALEKENSNDPDIQKYLMESRKKISKISFFMDEVKNIDNYPGYSNLFFVNSRDPLELISIKKMVKVTEGIYFRDIEIITLGPNSKINRHLHAAYGKFLFTNIPSVIDNGETNNNFITLNAIDRENKNIKASPVYYIQPKEITDLSQIIKLNPPIETLPYLQLNKDMASSFSLVELNTARKPLKDFGFPVLQLEIEFINRILKPILFLILCFFSIGLGWFLRSRYLARPPILQLFFLPFFPFVIDFIVNIIIYAFKILVSFFIISSGLWPALIAGVAVLTVILFLSIVYLASQIIE